MESVKLCLKAEKSLETTSVAVWLRKQRRVVENPLGSLEELGLHLEKEMGTWDGLKKIRLEARVFGAK